MTPQEERAAFARKMEDTAHLDAELKTAMAANSVLRELNGLKQSRGWSDQHFYAIATVTLSRIFTGSPAKE